MNRKKKKRLKQGAQESGLFDTTLLSRSRDLIAIAQDDRRAAEALFQARLYPQALFHLQQAVEKTVKAIGLSTRVITVGELQTGISHQAVKVYLAGLRKMIAIAQVQSHDPKATSQLGSWLQFGETERARFTNIALPTDADLTRWIAGHRSCRDDMQGFLDLPAARELVDEIREKSLPFDATEVPKRMVQGLITLLGLYFLCLATLAHAVPTRYGHGPKSPQDIYNAAHPLVVHFDCLVEVARECIDFAQAACAFVMSWK